MIQILSEVVPQADQVGSSMAKSWGGGGAAHRGGEGSDLNGMSTAQ